MKTFKEYLKEAQQINYDMANIISLRKRNIEAARDILKDQKEMIPDINNAKDLNQFDTEEQRDAVVATYILNKEQPEYAKSIGIDIQNPKNFETQVKDNIVDPTRHKAKELGIKNPTINQVKQSSEPTEKEIKRDEKEREDLRAAVAKPAPDEEPEETPDEEPEETPDEEPAKDKSGDVGLNVSSHIDTSSYVSPKEAMKQIEGLRKETIEKIQSAIPENPTREQRATIDNIVNKFNNKLNSYKREAQSADRGYSINPTSMSKLKSAGKATQALDKAQTAAENLASKAQRKQLDIGPVRLIKRVGEVGKAAVGKVKKATESRPAQILKQQAGRTLKNIGAAAKRGAEETKAATERVITNIAQNTTAKMITKELGAKKTQEYINYLKNNETNKAEAIAKEAAAKKQENRNQARVQSIENKALKQTMRGKGGAKSSAIAKRLTDKFRQTTPTTSVTGEQEKRA